MNVDFFKKDVFSGKIYYYEPKNCMALPFFKDDKMCDVLLFDNDEVKMLYGNDDCYWKKLNSKNDILVITINPLNISKDKENDNIESLQSSLIIPSPEFSKNIFMKITKLMKENKIRKIEMLCNKSSFNELIFTLKYVVEFCNFITKLNYSLYEYTIYGHIREMNLSVSFLNSEVKHLEVIQFISNLKQALRKELGIKPDEEEKEKLFDQYNYRELQTEYQDKVIMNIEFIAKMETLIVVMRELILFSSIEKKISVNFV